MAILTHAGRLDTAFTQNRSGSRTYLFDPRPGDYRIEDIAYGLSRRYRWNAQADLTVAQHCVLCYRYYPTLEMLLHDAAEAYLSDVPSQIKHHEAFEFYRVLEHRHMRAIALQFGFANSTDGAGHAHYAKSPKVDQVDKASRYLEGHLLFSPKHRKDWSWSGVADRGDFDGIQRIALELAHLYHHAGVWGPHQAYREFLGAFAEAQDARRRDHRTQEANHA